MLVHRLACSKQHRMIQPPATAAAGKDAAAATTGANNLMLYARQVDVITATP